MIAPDDARHGTNAGYCAGCREQCCKTAHADQTRRQRRDWRARVGYKPRSEYKRREPKPLEPAGITYERALEIAVAVYATLGRRQRMKWASS